MDTRIKNDIHEIAALRKKAHAYFLDKSEVYQAFVKMEEITFRDSALTKMNKELIAIGISVVLNCESCMEWHINQAFRDGASEAEILEAGRN